MRIGILTSSRADFGIYLPLLQKLEKDSFFSLEIIAFGTHLSKFHGYTLNEIQKYNFRTIHQISTLLTNDDENSIACSYGLTVLKFSEFWDKNKFDCVFCLGDRFEMSAAVQAGIPFRINFIHLFGGEVTLGAIDNIYRDQITLASKIHFTSTEIYKERVSEITGNRKNVYALGSLSLDEITTFVPVSKALFFQKFQLKDSDYALVTFHPETVALEKNHAFAEVMKKALLALSSSINIVVTMPNADTMGTLYREALKEVKSIKPESVFLVENFGKENYFSAIHYSKILIGNTSSGIIEAASFGKYVINVGDRQKGRAQSHNIINVVFDSEEIVKAVNSSIKLGEYDGENIYYKLNVGNQIIQILKTNEKL